MFPERPEVKLNCKEQAILACVKDFTQSKGKYEKKDRTVNVFFENGIESTVYQIGTMLVKEKIYSMDVEAFCEKEGVSWEINANLGMISW